MGYRILKAELDGVRTALRKAINEWESRFVYGESNGDEADKEYVEYLIRIAYLSLAAFLDKHKMTVLSEYLSNHWKQNESNLLESFVSDYAEMPLLLVTNTFWEIIEALSNITPESEKDEKDKTDFNILTVLNRWHPDDSEKINKAMGDYLSGKTDKYEIEHRLRHKDGTFR